MIISSLTGFERYTSMHEGFAKAFKYLRSTRLDQLTVGRHDIDGSNVFALVSVGQGKEADKAKLEVHDSYIDIQLLLEGSETMGWKDRAHCTSGGGAYNDEKDIAFYDDAPDVMFVLEPMNLAVFFPHDAHAPMIGSGTIRKIVLKVRV